MRINRPIGQLPIDASERRTRGTTSPPKSEQTEASIVSIKRSPSAGPSIDDAMAARLEEVRMQLETGTYRINYDRLAESIVASELGSETDK